MTQKIKCPHCGAEIQSGNFCSACGGKLVKVCDCKFYDKPFDCGYDKCPGFAIYRLVSHSHTQKALDAAQAKAEKLIATLKEAEALAYGLENAVAIDCDDFADRLAAVKALAQEKPPEGGNSIDA